MVSLTSRSTADPVLLSSIERLIAHFNEHHESGDVELIRRAGIAAINAHEGQLRRTGEPYATWASTRSLSRQHYCTTPSRTLA